MVEETNTIRIKQETIDKIKSIKIHPNQSYDELINELITFGISNDFISSSGAIQNKQSKDNN